MLLFQKPLLEVIRLQIRFGTNASAMADLANKYVELWLEAEKEQFKLSEKLYSIDEPYRSILYLRYVRNETFEHISEELHYSYRQTIRIHGQALNIFSELQKDEKDVT